MIVMFILCILVMIVYVDFDILVIDELLLGCIFVIIVVILDICCYEIIDCVCNVCIIEGCQVYWVCILIEELDLLEVQVVEVIWEEFKLVLLELNIGLVYGCMKFVEKQVVMQVFKQGELYLLVVIMVIEVGVDVFNVSLMIIENLE